MPITINTWPSKDGLRIGYLNINYAVNKLTEFRVQELCPSQGGRPGLSVLTSLRVSVDVKQY